MQRSFQSWRMKCQYSVKFTRSANTPRTRRRQVCIKWRNGAWEVSFLTPLSPKPRSATLRMVVLGLFNSRLMKYHTYSIGFKLGLLLGQFKTSTAFKAYQVLCDICRVAPWRRLVRQPVVVEVWHSLSVDDLAKMPSNVQVALDLDQWNLQLRGV